MRRSLPPVHSRHGNAFLYGGLGFPPSGGEVTPLPPHPAQPASELITPNTGRRTYNKNTHTHTHPQTHIHTSTRLHTHPHTHTRAHTHTHTHTLDDTAVFSEEVVSAESAHKGYSRRGHGTNNVTMNDQLSVSFAVASSLSARLFPLPFSATCTLLVCLVSFFSLRGSLQPATGDLDLSRVIDCC